MRGYLNNKSIKLGINKNTRSIRARKNVNSLIYNKTTVPQIIHYYYSGKQKVSNEETIIPIYFTDWYQREYYYNDDSLYFNIRLDLDGNISYINNLKAGDYNLSLGILDVGEHEYSIEVEDIKHGLKSQRLFNRIWIVDDSNDIKELETYNVTLDDFSNYNITLDLDNTATTEQLTNNRNGLTSLFEYYHNQRYKKIILPENSYIRINMQMAGETEKDTYNSIIPKPIVIPTNTTVDLNGSIIKLQMYDDREYGNIGGVYNNMIIFENCIDSHLINGTIQGDYFDRKEINYNYNVGTEENPKYEDSLVHGNGEHNGAITIYGGKYNTLDNLVIKEITGYNVMNEKDKSLGQGDGVNMCYHWGENMGCWLKGNNTDLVNGLETYSPYRLTSDYIDITKLLSNGYFSTGKYISDYPSQHYYEVKLSFFDSNKNFIEEYIAYQARNSKIPENSKYVRVTLNGKHEEFKEEGDFFLIPSFYPEYIEYNNLTFIDNRTCVAPNRFKHLRMYNCEFIRSGNDITPLIIDAEDGGATMQDLFIENCTVSEPGLTQRGDMIAVAGLNIVVQNNIGMGFGVRAEVVGATLRNNVGRAGSEISLGWRTNNTVRCYDNDFNETNVTLAAHKLYKSQVCVKNCSNLAYGNGWFGDSTDFLVFDGCKNILPSSNNYYKSCEFYFDSDLNIKHNTCTGDSIYDDCLFSCNTDEVSNFDLKSYNYGNSIENIGEFNNCEFNFKNSTFKIYPIINGAFVKGKFSNCIFNSPTTLRFLYNNNMGDIQFNSCTFNSSLTIDLKDAKVQFNNCTFNEISYLNNGQLNSEFNN